MISLGVVIVLVVASKTDDDNLFLKLLSLRFLSIYSLLANSRFANGSNASPNHPFLEYFSLVCWGCCLAVVRAHLNAPFFPTINPNCSSKESSATSFKESSVTPCDFNILRNVWAGVLFVLSVICETSEPDNSIWFPSEPLNFSDVYLTSGSFSLPLIVLISLANADSPRLTRALCPILMTDWIPAESFNKSLVSQSFQFLVRTLEASTNPSALNAFPSGTATRVTAFATLAIFPVSPR